MSETPPLSIEERDLPRIDVLSPEYAADPIAALRDARERGSGMAKSHRGVEFLSYEWVGSLLNDDRFHTVDARHFAQKGAPESLLQWTRDGLLLSMDMDRHDRVRKVLARAFTLRRVDQQHEVMQEVALKWIANFERSTDHDLVEHFTLHYPMDVLCRVIGVPPEESERFLGAASDLHLLAAVPMAPGFDRIDQALKTLEEYVVDIVARRAKEPGADFLSGLIEAQQTEGQLTQSELVGNVINLLFAGAGTTKYQLASAIRLFVELGLWEQLAARPELITPAIEESMRLAPVTQFVVRIPYDDVVIGEHLFPQGRRIILNLQAAARDPEMFPDPDRFDLTRENLTRSRLPFGWGAHHCLGHALARAAMREAAAMLTSRYTDVSFAAPVELSPPAGMLRGPDQLRLQYSLR